MPAPRLGTSNDPNRAGMCSVTPRETLSRAGINLPHPQPLSSVAPLEYGVHPWTSASAQIRRIGHSLTLPDTLTVWRVASPLEPQILPTNKPPR